MRVLQRAEVTLCYDNRESCVSMSWRAEYKGRIEVERGLGLKVRPGGTIVLVWYWKLVVLGDVFEIQWPLDVRNMAKQ